jgi:hypothetical protein
VSIGCVSAPGGRLAHRQVDRDLDESDVDEDLVGDDEDEVPVEWYLLEAWPAVRQDPQVLRMSSSYAQEQLNPGPGPRPPARGRRPPRSEPVLRPDSRLS